MGKLLPSIKSLHSFLKKQKPSSVYLITSKRLAKKLAWAIKELNVEKRNIIFIPDGEAAKEWRELEKILASLRTLGADRESIVIALGGGTVGDITGFASSIYLRGIRYVQIPTTLLAQVDSAHGGKTGIDFQGYKNQIGTTYDPVAIVLDARFLESLGKKEVIDGLGEIIKAGLINDPSILKLLAHENITSLTRSPRLPQIVDRAIRVKQRYVRRDPYERNVRRMLNFGHTIGHALELKHSLSHGYAVIAGMLEELRMTEAMNYTAPEVRKELVELLRNLGITVDGSLRLDTKDLQTDKKMSGQTLNLPVVERVGKSRCVRIPLATFCRYI